MTSGSNRAGRYMAQPSGYRAFVPAPLPPEPPIAFDAELIALLSRADQAIGRLDGAARTLPNPDLFVAMYVRREAVESSRIEGTQSTLEDLLSFELDPHLRALPDDVEEVVNYVRAMNHGLERIATLPLSLRLIREIHAELLQGTRGADRSPGEFRSTQNWIGAGHVSLVQATFVPPPVHELTTALDNLERFLHDTETLPPLVHCGVTHVQFETIHPFLDGNGRVGRLLIAFLLVHRGVLVRPLLYLSAYLKRHRAEYYDRLMDVRNNGNWEGWLRFFLRGVAETADEATKTASKIVDLQADHRSLLQEHGFGANEYRLLDLLYHHPLVNVALVRQRLSVTAATAGKVIDRLESLGMLEEITGRQRNRMFRYAPYWRLFQERASPDGYLMPPQETESALPDPLF
jgi:Fic family protein